MRIIDNNDIVEGTTEQEDSCEEISQCSNCKEITQEKNDLHKTNSESYLVIN